MICDNCKGETSHTIGKDKVKTELRLAWPPINHYVEKEMWCRRCYYWRLNGAAKPKHRRNMHKDD